MALKDNIQSLLSQVNDLKASNAEELEALKQVIDEAITEESK